MSAEGLIAQTSAGPALLAIRDKAACNPAEIRAIATRWRNTANKIGTDTGTLNGAVKNVDDVWEGASANDFIKYMQKYNWAGQELHDALTNCATSLDTLATTLQETKTSINTIYNNLVNQVTTYLKENPKATTTNIETTVNTARTNAQDHLDDATAAMDTTSSTLRRHLTDRAILFADINPPHKDPFTSPSTQHPPDWQKTIHPDPDQTTLAAANGGHAPGGSGGGGGNGGGSSTHGSGGAAPVLPYVAGSGTGADIVNAARANLGKPYVWGANGPSAFDCSGLVFDALNKAGIKIGDTTAAGYRASGQPITLPPQVGDIVFFGEGAEHCGIYVGEGKMINAPRPGEVVRIENVAGQQPIVYRRFTKN
ncbi:NlpC/P60 family protein [Streptosporangium subroseum]|uniref:bifunctional WXG100 family type VII secretion target/C40 family peptidase n=1 Tax=Streptosporangium subroseum TaxID=106412 RepID=UPI00343CFE99